MPRAVGAHLTRASPPLTSFAYFWPSGNVSTLDLRVGFVALAACFEVCFAFMSPPRFQSSYARPRAAPPLMSSACRLRTGRFATPDLRAGFWDLTAGFGVCFAFMSFSNA